MSACLHTCEGRSEVEVKYLALLPYTLLFEIGLLIEPSALIYWLAELPKECWRSSFLYLPALEISKTHGLSSLFFFFYNRCQHLVHKMQALSLLSHILQFTIKTFNFN